MKMVACALALTLAMGVGVAGAEERFGVAVYPGATSDAFTAAHCADFNAESVKQARGQQVSEAACFRTSDDFTKVVGFYQHDKAVMPLGQPIDKGPQRSALFCLKGMKCASLGSGVDVMVSTPWTDGKQRYEDVLISIRRAARK
jgi:hypothetical protein